MSDGSFAFVCELPIYIQDARLQSIDRSKGTVRCMKGHRKEKREAEKTSFFNAVIYNIILKWYLFSLPWDFESVRLLRTPVASRLNTTNAKESFHSLSFDPVYDPFPGLPFKRSGCTCPIQVGHGGRESGRRVLRTLKPINKTNSLFFLSGKREI